MHKAEVRFKGGKKLKAIGYFQKNQSIIRLLSNRNSFQKVSEAKSPNIQGFYEGF
jgi:hypothetical protein